MEDIQAAYLVCVWPGGSATNGISFRLHLKDCCDSLPNIPSFDCYYAGQHAGGFTNKHLRQCHGEINF